MLLEKEILIHSTDEYQQLICKDIYKNYLTAIKKHGYFTFVLSGGNTPLLVFKELVLSYLKKIDWMKVHFFWTDERCVEPGHSESNYKLADDNLLQFISPGSVCRVIGERSPVEAANDYEKKILDFFHKRDAPIKFDYVLLGVGEDGHVASIFPGIENIKAEKSITDYTPKAINGNYRVSLRLQVLNESRHLVCMVSNEQKRALIKTNGNLPINAVSANIFFTLIV